MNDINSASHRAYYNTSQNRVEISMTKEDYALMIGSTHCSFWEISAHITLNREENNYILKVWKFLNSPGGSDHKLDKANFTFTSGKDLATLLDRYGLHRIEGIDCLYHLSPVLAQEYITATSAGT